MPDTPPHLLDTVRRKLSEALAPEHLEIRDDTRKHARHREAAGRAHLAVRIVSARFAGLGPLERHRLVYDILAAELEGPLHALRLHARPPAHVREG